MRLIDADAFIRYADEPSIFDTTDLKAMIGEQPTIEAAPVVHGRWIIHTDNFTPYRQCTECGFEMPLISSEKKENNMKYCNNCGAIMDKKEHNNA